MIECQGVKLCIACHSSHDMLGADGVYVCELGLLGEATIMPARRTVTRHVARGSDQ